MTDKAIDEYGPLDTLSPDDPEFVFADIRRALGCRPDLPPRDLAGCVASLRSSVHAWASYSDMKRETKKP